MSPQPFAYESAPRFTRAQVDLVNWFQRAVPGVSAWRRWIRTVLAESLESPAEPVVWIEETHCLGQRDAVRHDLAAGVTIIGRSEQAGIVASAPAIAREHARLRLDGPACSVEDLDSKVGTFLAGKRMQPGKPEALRDGDSFTIFPYNYKLRVEQKWIREERVDLMAGTAVPCTYGSFRSSSASGRVMRGIGLEPENTGFVMELGQAFVAELARRTLHPVSGRAGSATGSGEMEDAAAEYLLLSVAELASREFAFPFELSVLRAGATPPIGDAEPGVALSCTIGLSQLSGAIRIFVPRRALAAIERMPAMLDTPGPGVVWRCAVTVGSVDLNRDELASRERGDVLLYTPAAQLRLPGGRAYWRGDLASDGNFRLTLADNSEEPIIMSAAMPDTMDPGNLEEARLDALPVRLSIIAGERELSFAELKQLSRGSIVELDRGPADAVTIALNGRAAGTGELVRIDEKLGVRILSWKEPA
ncbi:MAG: FliM/FliN family flagellar motor switch protein [Bryobacteraceae bacterium]